MPLSREQERLLHAAAMNGAAPTDAEIEMLPGFHFCPEWDFEPICRDSPEWEACICEGYNGRVSVATPRDESGKGGVSD